MFVLIAVILTAAVLIAAYVSWNVQKGERQKYYAAAYQMVKETSLNQAIRKQKNNNYDMTRTMVYLKWKDRKKQGYVFEPEQGVRIGRAPETNEICVREQEVSMHHCQLYMAGGRLAVQDLQSVNGTWIRRGLRKHLVQGAEYIYSGDKLLVGSVAFRVIIFTFDMAYL